MKLSGASRCLTWPTKANDSSPVDSYPYFWGREINHFYQGDRVNYPGPKDTWCDLFFSVYPGDSRVTQEKLAPVPNFLPDTQSEGVWIQNLSTFCQVRTINVSLVMKIYNGGIIPACDNDFSYLNRVIFFQRIRWENAKTDIKERKPDYWTFVSAEADDKAFSCSLHVGVCQRNFGRNFLHWVVS